MKDNSLTLYLIDMKLCRLTQEIYQTDASQTKTTHNTSATRFMSTASYMLIIFIFLLILVVQPTVSKLLSQKKSLYFSTHFCTLAYRPNLFLFLRILVVQPTVIFSAKKRFQRPEYKYFSSQYTPFSSHFGSLAYCEKTLQNNLVLASRVYNCFFSSVCVMI